MLGPQSQISKCVHRSCHISLLGYLQGRNYAATLTQTLPNDRTILATLPDEGPFSMAPWEGKEVKYIPPFLRFTKTTFLGNVSYDIDGFFCYL